MGSIACVGDRGEHGPDYRTGVITTSGNDNTLGVDGDIVAVVGAHYNCSKHGNETIVSTPVVKTRLNGKLIVTAGAVASCGAVILPTGRTVSVE